MASKKKKKSKKQPIKSRIAGRPSVWGKRKQPPIGTKRDPDVILALKGRIVDALYAEPGIGIERLGQKLGEATASLSLPIRQLRVDKVVRVRGEKRATKYSPRSR